MLVGLAVSAAAARAEVCLSEIVASNKLGIADENGARADWIEIHNRGEQPADLKGWHLTDDPGQLSRWEFPDVSLPAGGFLVVYASGKDRSSAGGALHTDFRLSAEGEYLALSDPDGLVVDSFAPGFPAQTSDVSWGQVSGEQRGVRAYFYIPTPGAENSAASRAADAPVIGSRSGTFVTDFHVTIATSAPDAQIFYTLDGSQPVPGDNLYTRPLQVNTTIRLRALATRPGMAPSPVRGENYVRMSTGLNPSSNLPLVVIDNFGAGRPDSATAAAWMVFDPAHDTDAATFLAPPSVATNAVIKVRGSSTAGAAKYSLAIEAQNEGGGDRDLSITAFPEDSDWILQSAYEYDRSLIRNSLMFGLSNDAGRYAPRSRYVEVYLNTDGGALSPADYFGVYSLTEKIKRSSDRLAITEISPLDNAEPAVTGGYILKIDRADPGEIGLTAAAQKLYFVDPDEPDVNPIQLGWLSNYLNSWWRALNAVNFYDPADGYAKWGDAASFVDHHIFNVAAKNVDAFRLSAYFTKDRQGRLTAGPLWDFDRSMDSTDGRDNNYSTWRGETGDLGTDFFQYPWYNEMFRDQNFWQAWIDRYEDLRQGVLSHAHVQEAIAAETGELASAAARNFVRWADKPPRFGGWSGEVANLQNFLLNRLSWMDSQFTRPPTANTSGGTAASRFSLKLNSPSLSRPDAKIYYTIDGSDPRLFDTTNNQQIVTTAFIPLDSPVKVMLPVSDPGTSWRSGSSYDDSAWWSGTQGVGYDDATDYDPFIGFNLESPPPERRMKNVIQSCYLRYHFTASAGQISEMTFLKLRARCDDGIVVWLNGIKLPASIKEPSPLLWNSGATTNTPDTIARQFVEFNLTTNPHSVMVPGDNVMAVHGLNFGLNSSDFLIQLELTGGHVPVDGPEISPSAIEYTGPVSVTATTHFVARTFDPAGPFTPYAAGHTPVGSHWSAPLRLSLLVGTEPPSASALRLVEIMYHPPPISEAESAAGFDSREHFEYLVLENISASPLNLAGMQVTNGITFTMPLGPLSVLHPKQRALLVKNRAAFEFRYTTPYVILGEYGGSLSNGGEKIEILSAAGSGLLAIAWDDEPGWHAKTDGKGYSLVLRDGAAEFGTAGAWRPSLDPMGELNRSPGFNGWQSAWFPNGGADALPLSDPDKDGSSNAAEFAAATSPLAPDAGAQPVAGAPDASCFSISLRRRRGVNAWALEGSNDMALWTPVFATPAVTPNADGSETVVWCFPKSTAKTFYRARSYVK